MSVVRSAVVAAAIVLPAFLGACAGSDDGGPPDVTIIDGGGQGAPGLGDPLVVPGLPGPTTIPPPPVTATTEVTTMPTTGDTSAVTAPSMSTGREVDAGSIDCGEVDLASGWPTTILWAPAFDCIVEAFVAGTPAIFDVRYADCAPACPSSEPVPRGSRRYTVVAEQVVWVQETPAGSSATSLQVCRGLENAQFDLETSDCGSPGGGP